LTELPPPIWSLLESDVTSRHLRDADHWVSIYTNLLSLLSRGASVSIGERKSGGALVDVSVEAVRERLEFWRQRTELGVAGSELNARWSHSQAPLDASTSINKSSPVLHLPHSVRP
jgi:hypothetical protein